MEAFTTHTGRAMPLRRSNVDTDQIIPAVWLKQVSRTGFEKGLFAAWREDPGFVLNRPEYTGASILVVGLALPFFYFMWSLKYGKRAHPNPWHATGLEWQTPSPPPTHNFHTQPVVAEEAYQYEPYRPQGSGVQEAERA